MKEIKIKTIPHIEQRYDTAGDYWWNGDILEVRVSDLGDWRANMCVAVHEIVEALLTHHEGISEESISGFDIENTEDNDPGDHPKAPYHREHCLATAVERMLVALLGLKWREYDALFENLPGI